MPYDRYKKFRDACGNEMDNIIPYGSALRDAREHFNLYPKSILLEFIYNDGLEDLSHINTKKWDKNPNPSVPIYVDAYEFRTLSKLGYIAFMHNPATQKWIIKSFKPSRNTSPAMFIALQKAGLIDSEENK